MKGYLKKQLIDKIHTEDILSVEYDLPKDITSDQIDYQKIRGSVRLMLEKVLTQKEFEETRARVFAFKFF